MEQKCPLLLSLPINFIHELYLKSIYRISYWGPYRRTKVKKLFGNCSLLAGESESRICLIIAVISSLSLPVNIVPVSYIHFWIISASKNVSLCSAQIHTTKWAFCCYLLLCHICDKNLACRLIWWFVCINFSYYWILRKNVI